MQLLAHFETRSYDDWRAEFDGDAEDRMAAGLTLLQMWRGADEPAHVTCLFEVNNRAKAETWLAKETGFGAAVTSHFLKTA